MISMALPSGSADLQKGPDMSIVKRHGGFAIHHGHAGYRWVMGDEHFETLAECIADIDAFNRSDRDNDPSWPPTDTPSLGDLYSIDY